MVFSTSSNKSRHNKKFHLKSLENPVPVKEKHVKFETPAPPTPTTSAFDMDRIEEYIHNTVKMYMSLYIKKMEPKKDNSSWFLNPAFLKVIFLSIVFVYAE